MYIVIATIVTTVGVLVVAIMLALAARRRYKWNSKSLHIDSEDYVRGFGRVGETALILAIRDSIALQCGVRASSLAPEVSLSDLRVLMIDDFDVVDFLMNIDPSLLEGTLETFPIASGHLRDWTLRVIEWIKTIR